MGLSRSALLWVSENRTLRRSLPKLRFVRNAVTRFMPGETVEEAVDAALQLKERSLRTIFTQLGENITSAAEAAAVKEHYLGVLELVGSRGLDTFISVKLTQLGLDLDRELCREHLEAIAGRAQSLGNMLWIDIEQSQYVDRTIELYTALRKRHPNVGICLQAYLRRTGEDLRRLLPLSPAVRLVKGAYREPPEIAFPSRREVDQHYLSLATALLGQVRAGGVYAAIATHDVRLHAKIIGEAERLTLSPGDYEFQMLYGIKMQEQQRLAAQGYRVRTLISYGSYWFPWYVRRLAERPANVWFVLKNMFR